MTHYVCPHCGNQSRQPGVCQVENCINQGGALKECYCEDGKHEGVIAAAHSDDPEEKKETTIDLDGENL